MRRWAILVIFLDWQQKLWFQTAWAVDLFPKFVSCCLNAKIYKCMITCLYDVFFFLFFTFGQSPVQVKQITFSFFKILQKALVFRSKGIQNLNTEQKRTKIRHRNVKNRKTTSRFTKISINRPPLFWWFCKSGTSHLKETPSFRFIVTAHETVARNYIAIKWAKLSYFVSF